MASGKVVINLSTGLDENPEKAMLGFFAAESALKNGKQTLMFLSLDAVRIALPGVAKDVVPCRDCPSIEKLLRQTARLGLRIYACPVCLRARSLEDAELIEIAEAHGTQSVMDWIGEGDATVFSF